MNFTYNNHLKYKIGSDVTGYRDFGYREQVTDKFKVSVGAIDKDHYATSNWVQEQYRTADIIRREYGKDFVVMFSGGTDSEIVLRAFKHIGVTPRVVFIKFNNDYNHGDMVYAIQIANSMDLKLEIIPFDIINFYRSGLAAELATELQCSQMAYLSVYYHVAKLCLPAVMGGEMLMKRITKPNFSEWSYCFRENEDASAMRFSHKYGIPLVNEWFSYTPEMMGYYLEHPVIKSMLTENNYKLTSVSTKNSVLYTYMPDIVKKIKTHGFEKILGFNGETYAALSQCYVKRLESSLDGIYIRDLYKSLHGEDYVSSEVEQQS